MQAYILRRLLLAVLTVAIVSVLIFTILRVAPGDVAMMVYTQGDEGVADIDQEALQRIRENLGLDDPVHLQYMKWVGNMLTLDWGTSYFHGGSVWDDFKGKLPVTLQLALMTITISVIVAIPGGDCDGVEAGHVDRLRFEDCLPGRDINTQLLVCHVDLGGGVVLVQLVSPDWSTFHPGRPPGTTSGCSYGRP